MRSGEEPRVRLQRCDGLNAGERYDVAMFRRLLMPTPYRALVPLVFIAKMAVIALVLAALILYVTREPRRCA